MNAPLRFAGMLQFCAAWLIPWKPVFATRAAQSGLIFFAHRCDVGGRHIAKYGTREPELTRFIADWLAASPPGLFVDVGANFGWHTVHAARVASTEAVAAFEPDAFNAGLLDRNLAANGVEKAVVVAAAVGERNGTAHFFRYKTSNTGRHSIVVDHHRGSRMVPLVTLDTALDDLGWGERAVNLLKIDVEGAEPGVIAGAERTLARTRAVVLEFSPALSDRAALDAMAARLDAAGFSLFVLSAAASPQPREWTDLRQSDAQSDLVWLRRG